MQNQEVGTGLSNMSSPQSLDSTLKNNDEPAMADRIEDSKDGLTSNQSILEQELPLLQAVKTFPAAVLWSVCISAALIMESYDISVVTNLTAVAPFNRKFGRPIGDGQYQVDPSYQSLLSVAPAIGEIVGLLINGWAADRYGHKKVIFAAISVLAAFLFVPFFAQTLGALVAGFFLVGIPLGVLQTACVAYASEACPVSLRAQLTTYTNLCWVVGQLIASGAWRGFENRPDEWSYKGTMAIQWIWPIPLGIAVLLSPESPWWLLGRGRKEECKTALRRLCNRRHVQDSEIDAYMVLMKQTIEREKAEEEASKALSYLDCFRGANLRRTEIVTVTWVNQITCGAALMGYASYFFQTIGLSASTAFTISIAMNCLGLVGTVAAWPVMTKIGRRDMYLWGTICMSVCLLWMGIASVTGTSSSASAGYSASGQWAMVASLLVWAVCYQSTVGPVCYAIVSEIPATVLRSKTMVLGCAAYNAMGIPILFLMTHMLNPGAWNWSGKVGFFWGGITALVSLWVFFRLPEPKGRSYAELDILFEHWVPARRFRSTVVTDGELATA